MSQANKDTVRHLRENAPRDLTILNDLFTDDYVYHGIPLLGDIVGEDAFKAMYANFVGAVADFREDVVDQIAEGDKVVTRFEGSGRHAGKLLGATPTGNPITWGGMLITRFENGKIAEEWATFDAYDFMQQLGLLPKT